MPRSPKRILITAGPTHEPIDGVRFLGNRSSGRLGVALAAEASRRGHDVRLLLGPATVPPAGVDPGSVTRFRTAADLQALLAEHGPWAEVLIMAAAVADFRPVLGPSGAAGKLRRGDQRLTLELEPTPDLLAGVAAKRRPGQTLVGFALEPIERLDTSAREKLARKRVDFIVANPLETMDAESISAVLYAAQTEPRTAPAGLSKEAFAGWLLEALGV
jgi:phosphopantothenoylcysteine decarboxylase/phosphopantothenate--cysteine ligase